MCPKASSFATTLLVSALVTFAGLGSGFRTDDAAASERSKVSTGRRPLPQPLAPRPGSVGSGAPTVVVPGSEGVSPQGEFTYSIPLKVPDGRDGMQPSLALTYSSEGGNGLLGIGWALSGLSMIARCPRSLTLDG